MDPLEVNKDAEIVNTDLIQQPETPNSTVADDVAENQSVDIAQQHEKVEKVEKVHDIAI